MELFGEGQYNFQSLKEIVVTDSFMGLDTGAKNCQNIETVEDCNTRLYIEHFRQQCGCLPFSLKLSEKVQSTLWSNFNDLKVHSSNVIGYIV